jgi:hypothetical protein
VSLPLCLFVSAVALAQPVGPEFRVNTYTTSRQTLPAVASDSSGNFVVVWESLSQGVFGQRYASTGEPLDPEFRVNTYTTDTQEDPVVASDSSGNFVVVWESDSQDGSSRGVFGQRYATTGEPLGPEFRVNTYTTNQQENPAVASDSSGNFVVVWTTYTQDGSSLGVFGQRYDSSGAPLGPEFPVNTFTTGIQYFPAVASDSSGNFVVVWRSWDGSPSGVFGQRFASTGEPLGPEFQVNTYTPDAQEHPAVASDSSGNFVVVWESCCQDGSISNSGVFGQRYDSSGAPLGPEFRVNTYTMNSQYRPAVTSNPSGNFVVVWASCCQDGSNSGVFGQRYDSSGAPLGPEFRVNTYTTDRQTHPAVTSNASGNFVVAWASYSQDGSSGGVFGQRFSAACEASVQVNGASPDVYIPGSKLAIRIHIAHKRPETVTVPWELSLIAASGWVVAERVTPPHTFEPGDVVDVDLTLTLPDDLEEGTYTLRLAISGMAGTEGATTSFRVVRAE